MASTNKKSSIWKILGIIFATLVFLLCVCVWIWWYYIFWMGPEIQISNTYNVGLQEATDGTTKTVIEVKYFKNSNGSGLEALEIKLNAFSDETQTLFTSQGMQFVENEEGAGLTWTFRQDNSIERTLFNTEHEFLLSWRKSYNGFGRLEPTSQYNNYSSMDDFAHPAGSADPITENSYFTIQIGEDLFMMKFKDHNYDISGEDPYQVVKNAGVESHVVYNYLETNYNYMCFDEQWLAQTIYNLVQPMAAGTNSISYFTFGDYFNYYKYDAASGQYVDTSPAETEKVIVNMRSNFSIKFEVTADGLNRASQSMFKSVLGTPNYNANGDFNSDDFYTGKTVIVANEYDLDFIKVDGNFYAARLDDNFIEQYEDLKNEILISLQIDLDNLASQNISFVGLVDNWNPANFEVASAYTFQIVDGETVEEVIAC